MSSESDTSGSTYKMVVLSDKTDYGSFAEPLSSGTVIPGTSGIVATSSGNIHTNSYSRNNSVSSNSNSGVSLVESDPIVASAGQSSINNNARNRQTNSKTCLSLNVGESSERTNSTTAIDSSRSVDEPGRGARTLTLGSTTDRLRNNSGNNNNNLTTSGQSRTRLSPTDTVVVLNKQGNKGLNINETTTQTYSNSCSPMSTNSGDLYQRQPLLQECENGWIDHDGEADNEMESPISSDGKRRGNAIRIDIPSDPSVTTLKRYPKEKKKTAIAFLMLCCNFVLATLSLALTHERVPETNPLPDIVLDNIKAQDRALDVSDILVALSTLATGVVLLLHRHRWIVFRRIFLILACLYLMRSITIYVTVLPVASYTYKCSPKSNNTSVLEIIGRVVKLVSGFGLSINGQHTYCGDYIYSGHTVILVTAYLFIQEYTPKKLFYLHWASWIASCLGIVMMLISRGHYTVDVLIAYYVATRLFWIYHTLANNPNLKAPVGQNGSSNNFLARLWWFPLFRYMEGNVGGPLPRQYSLPWSSKERRPRRSI